MAVRKVSNTNDELTKISDAIDQEEMRVIPLDTPSVDEDGIVRNVPLLAGYQDKDGIIHSTFSYREMTGKDEEAINKADVRANSAKLINVLCERCVIEIGTLSKKEVGQQKWGEIIRSMLGNDIDYMAFKIRELSKGTEVEFVHECPNCGQKLHTIINTDEFEIIPFKGMYEVEFDLVRGYKDLKGNVYKHGVFRLPNGYDREVLAPSFRKNPSVATTLLLTRCMSFEGTVTNQMQVSDMSLRDRDILEKIVRENSFGVNTTIEGIICDNCGRDISGELGQSNFF